MLGGGLDDVFRRAEEYATATPPLGAERRDVGERG
jgi:hypothetical protein